MTQTKLCPHCETTKLDSEFQRRKKDGRLQSWCKTCTYASAERSRKKHGPYKRSPEYHKEWRKAHPESTRNAVERWRNKNPDKIKESYLKRKYNISLGEYERMLTFQNGLCAICLQPEHIRLSLAVDHCHKTGRVRRLLCNKCNSLLGMVNDSPDLLRKAAAYIEEFYASVGNF